MVRDKTLKATTTLAAIMAFSKGSQSAEKRAVSVLVPLLTESKRYLCTKNANCPEQLAYCSRRTDEPCCFRKENPRLIEFMSIVKNLLKE